MDSGHGNEIVMKLALGQPGTSANKHAFSLTFTTCAPSWFQQADKETSGTAAGGAPVVAYFASISAMPTYQAKSVEELRCVCTFVRYR